jgi:hypothetical protein
VEWQVLEVEPSQRRVLRELGESPWLLVYYPGPRALEEIQRLGREARPGELLDPEAQAAAEVEMLKTDLLSVLGDVHSQAFYGKLAWRAQEEPRLKELIYRCLSEVKEEAHEGLIRTTKGAVFTDKLKRYCRERGIELGLRGS